MAPAAGAAGAAAAIVRAVKPLDWVNGAVTVAKDALPSAYAKTGLSQGVEKDELRPGDHIYAWRLGIAYQHHGVVVKVEACSGPSCTHRSPKCCAVVHFRPPVDGDRGCIELTSLASFADGREICRVRYGVQDAEFYLRRSGCVATERPDTWPVVTFRALGVLRASPPVVAADDAAMTEDEKVEYDMLSKNSELLARWCELGAASGVRHFRSAETARSLQTAYGRFLRLGLAAAAVTAAAGVTAAVATGAVGGGAAAASGAGAAAAGASAAAASGAAEVAGAVAGASVAEGAVAVAAAAAVRAIGKEIASSVVVDVLRNPKKAMEILHKAVPASGSSGPRRPSLAEELALRREQDEALVAAFSDCLVYLGVVPPKAVRAMCSSPAYCCRLSALLVDILEVERLSSTQACAAVVQRFLDGCQLSDTS